MIFSFFRLENKINNKKIDDIEVAVRKYPRSTQIQNLKIGFIVFPSMVFIFSFLFIYSKSISRFPNSSEIYSEVKDESVLGHFPYKETSNENLIEIEPNILIHKGMHESLLKMKEDAEKEGVYLVFLSGYRSIKLQKQIFYSLKSIRNQVARERARVSAPPGYSEHSTGFAIDIGDSFERGTDFEKSFENTNAFKWLERNAAKYHFRLSFDKNQTSVDYEPWHWRYEGSIEALKIFESSNRKSS